MQGKDGKREKRKEKIMGNKTKTYKIYCILETLSPLTHMMGVSGNESLINREPIVYKNRKVFVPVISGNSIRHRMLRHSGSMYLIKEMGIEGKLNLDQLDFMFYGGRLYETKTTTNLSKIAAMEEIFPLFRLLGGSLKNQILAGSLDVWRGLLVCEENRETINKYLPEEYRIKNKLLPADLFVGNYQYTRGDVKSIRDISSIAEDANFISEREKSNLMIYNGQQVNRNSLFFHGFSTKHISEIEVGCLFHSLQLWSEDCGTIGGMSAKGHGKVIINCIIPDIDLNISDCVLAYINHVKENKKKMIEWLNDNFSKKEVKGDILNG